MAPPRNLSQMGMSVSMTKSHKADYILTPDASIEILTATYPLMAVSTV